MSFLPGLRITELLAARLCHELIGPITAVGNGIELLLEQPTELDQEAMAVVAESARRTSSRLQFYRFAYGFEGESPAAGPAPFELAASYFETSQVGCHYHEGVRSLALAQQKLACNLLLIGAEALPRGGSLTLDVVGPTLQLEAVGGAVSPASEQLAALALRTPIAELTSRTVQGYFTGLLAQAQGLRLAPVTVEPQRLRIVSKLPGAG